MFLETLYFPKIKHNVIYKHLSIVQTLIFPQYCSKLVFTSRTFLCGETLWMVPIDFWLIKASAANLNGIMNPAATSISSSLSGVCIAFFISKTWKLCELYYIQYAYTYIYYAVLTTLVLACTERRLALFLQKEIMCKSQCPNSVNVFTKYLLGNWFLMLEWHLFSFASV